MKVNWLKLISVAFLLCTFLSCGKDDNGTVDERLSEASYYNHSQNCITTTLFRVNYVKHDFIIAMNPNPIQP